MISTGFQDLPVSTDKRKSMLNRRLRPMSAIGEDYKRVLFIVNLLHLIAFWSITYRLVVIYHGSWMATLL
jgi:hypothetical protein